MKLYKSYGIVLIVSFSLYFVIYKYQWIKTNSAETPILLAWENVFCPDTAYFPTVREIQCGDNRCILTGDESFAHQAQAFLFYGTNINKYHLPLPRVRNGTRPIWALYHEESPLNQPFLLFNEGLELFDFIATFSRYSDMPLTLQGLPSLDLITDKKYFVDVNEKNKLMDHLAPVLYLSSHCDVPSKRDEIVKELMKYVKVDAYGKCLNNKDFEEGFNNDDYLNSFYKDHTLRFYSKYKFVIAIENAFCNDYITEKIWKALIAGTIPIYKGSSTIQDWLPNFNKSAIIIDNFKNVEELANFILKLNANDSLYNQYLEHKLDQKITNKYLVDEMEKKSRLEDLNNINNYMVDFPCKVCNYLNDKPSKKNVSSKSYFDCSAPSRSWEIHWKIGECLAVILNKMVMVMNLGNISIEEFNKYDQTFCGNIWGLNWLTSASLA